MTGIFAARPAFAAMILAASAALGGCAGDGSLKGTAEAAGLATSVAEPKPFVREGRRGEVDYVPVGTAVTRQAKRKTPEEFKTIEARLEAKRLSNEAAGNQARRLGATQPPKPADVTLPTN